MVTFANLGSVRQPSLEDTAHLVCQLSIYNSFPVIRTTIEKKLSFLHTVRTPPSIFVCPGDAPVAITQNVAWMKRQFSACQTSRSMYPSIFNTFPVIRTTSAKNRRFHVPQPTLLFPLETPLWQSRNMLHRWKDNSMLAKPLAAYTHLPSMVSQLFEPQVQKIAVLTYRSPHFCFPWRHPCNYHAICCMGGKNFEDMFIRFAMIHERDRRTDTHRITAYTALMHTHRTVKSE